MKKIKRNVPAALLRAQITDLSLEEIALSPQFRNLLEKSANSLLYSHNRSRKTQFQISFEPNDPLTACTDDYSCYMNAANKMYVESPDEKEIPVKESCMRLYGAAFHEVGHILYTCFSEMKRMHEIFKRGDLDIADLEEDFEEPYKELTDVLKNEKAVVLQGFNAVPIRDFIMFLYMNLSNCIEDGRIEKLLLQNDTRFSGLVAGLNNLRQYHEATGATWDMSKQDIPTFMNLCLMYAKYHSVGTYTGGFEAFDKAMPIIDEMLETNEAKVFSQMTQKVLLCIWPLIKDLIIEAEGDGEGSSDTKGESENAEGQSGQSGDAGENSSEDSQQSSGNGGSSKEDKLNETMKKIQEQIQQTYDEERSNQSDAEETNQKQEDASGDEGNNTNQPPATSQAPEGNPSTTTLEATIGDIMKDIADEKSRDEAMEKSCEKAKEKVMAGKGFAPYFGTRVLNVKPTSYVDSLDIATESAIKKAAREIQRHLETDMRTGTSKRKFSGKKFHAEKVVNRDFRYFENTARRKDVPKVKVGLVIDESGSMSCGSRYSIARNAAITLYKIFEYIPNLDIAIYGHSTRGEVEIYDYADFGIKQKDMVARLSNISARGGNIDVVPITVMAENLLQQDADSRIMFIITDGLPYSYVKGKTPEEELTEVANNYSRKGIEIIVASIGDDEEVLKNIYKCQRFLSLSNPTELPRKVVNVIKRKL